MVKNHCEEDMIQRGTQWDLWGKYRRQHSTSAQNLLGIRDQMIMVSFGGTSTSLSKPGECGEDLSLSAHHPHHHPDKLVLFGPKLPRLHRFMEVGKKEVVMRDDFLNENS